MANGKSVKARRQIKQGRQVAQREVNEAEASVWGAVGGAQPKGRRTKPARGQVADETKPVARPDLDWEPAEEVGREADQEVAAEAAKDVADDAAEVSEIWEKDEDLG